MKRIISITLSLIFILSMASLFAFADTTITPNAEWTVSGDGIYYINSEEDFLAFTTSCATETLYLDKTVKLTKDLNFTGVTNWVVGTYFYGTFDGQGHTIQGVSYSVANQNNSAVFFKLFGGTVKNLTIKDCTLTITTAPSNGWIGLFSGSIYGHDAIIENVQLLGCSVTSGSNFVGAFAGRGAKNLTISNCYSNTYVDGNASIGGFVGNMTSGNLTMTNCVNAGNIKATGNQAGGLIGQMTSGYSLTMSNCANTGNINSTSLTGGILGMAPTGSTISMTDVLFAGTLTATGYRGGIIGKVETNATLTRCVNLATLSGNAGGLVFLYTSGDEYTKASTGNVAKTITFTDCYSVGNTASNFFALGEHHNARFSCFNIYNVYGTEQTDVQVGCAGAARASSVAELSGQISSSFQYLANGTVSLTTDNFASDYPILASKWVLTGDTVTYGSTTIPVIMPEGAAKLLNKCPIPQNLTYQISEENLDGTINVRFFALVDDLRYTNVGFKIIATRDNGVTKQTSKEINVSSTAAYGSIVAGGNTVTAESLGGKYLVCVTINNINYQDYETEFTISAYVTMPDGTEISTVAKTAVLEKK